MINKVLITGGTGFIGKIFFKGFGANSLTLGRKQENNIIFDLASGVPALNKDIDVVIHNAGLAHFSPKTEEEKKSFFKVNVEGTKNLLEGIEKSECQLKQFIFISTTDVYGRESGINTDENHPLLASIPYAVSKLEAENLLRTWGEKNKVPVLIFRLPLVVGNAPVGNLGRMIEAIKKGKYLSINKGKARKSAVLAEDLISCIKNNIGKSGIYNLTDGHHPSFKEFELLFSRQLGVNPPKNLPVFLGKILAIIGDFFSFFPLNTKVLNKMSSDSTFCDQKARKEIGWQPRRVLDYFKSN